MEKCFVLSLHRSGTKSIAVLLNALGIRTVHFPGKHNGENLQLAIRGREDDLDFVFQTIRPLLDEYDAACDVPIPVLYRQLDIAYPGSRFVLLKRNPMDWAKSARKNTGRKRFRPFSRVQYWHYFKNHPSRIGQLTDDDLVGMYERHLQEVTGYFGPRLGVFDRLDPDCGSKVAAHLGIETDLRLTNPPENGALRKRQGRLRRLWWKLTSR